MTDGQAWGKDFVEYVLREHGEEWFDQFDDQFSASVLAIAALQNHIQECMRTGVRVEGRIPPDRKVVRVPLEGPGHGPLVAIETVDLHRMLYRGEQGEFYVWIGRRNGVLYYAL